MRLRAEPPRVTRLSRKVLAGLGLVASVGLGGALIYALQTRDAGRPNDELYSTENRSTADGLAGLPRDYSGVPQLGPLFPVTSAGRSLVPVIADSRCPHPDGHAQSRHQPGRAAPPSGNRDRAHQPSLLRIGKPGHTRCCGSCPSARAGAGFGEHWPRSAARHALGAGPAERVSERRGRSQDGCARSRRCASIAERPSGGSSDIRGADHRHPIRSTRPDHRAGHRKHLRQPNRPYLACAARHSCGRAVRQQRAVRPEPSPARLDSARLRTGARSFSSASLVLTLKGSPGCRMASITIGGIWPRLRDCRHC